MWTITLSRPRSNELASLSVECPHNLRAADQFGLLIAVWCQRVRDRIEVDGIVQPFSFGFLAGEVFVESTGGRISNQGRLSVEAARFKIVNTEVDQAKKGAAVEGKIAADLPKWLSFGRTGVELGGHLNRTVSKTEQKEGEQYRIFWRVADAGYNFWRIFGIGLNQENLLENKILGDEPLCYIEASDKNQIDVNVSFRCDLRDLWFQRETTPHPIDRRFDNDQEEKNRTAVARRVIAVALNRKSTNADVKAGYGAVILAAQKLTSVRSSNVVTGE